MKGRDRATPLHWQLRRHNTATSNPHNRWFYHNMQVGTGSDIYTLITSVLSQGIISTARLLADTQREQKHRHGPEQACVRAGHLSGTCLRLEPWTVRTNHYGIVVIPDQRPLVPNLDTESSQKEFGDLKSLKSLFGRYVPKMRLRSYLATLNQHVFLWTHTKYKDNHGNTYRDKAVVTFVFDGEKVLQNVSTCNVTYFNSGGFPSRRFRTQSAIEINATSLRQALHKVNRIKKGRTVEVLCPSKCQWHSDASKGRQYIELLIRGQLAPAAVIASLEQIVLSLPTKYVSEHLLAYRCKAERAIRNNRLDVGSIRLSAVPSNPTYRIEIQLQKTSV